MRTSDWVRRSPLGTFADVPVQRGVVGAVSPTMGSRQPDHFLDGFTAYVYRGTGEDTLTAHLDAQPRVKKAKTRKPKPRKPRSEWRPRLSNPRHPDHDRYYRTPPKYHVDDPRHPDYERNHPNSDVVFLETEPEAEPEPKVLRRSTTLRPSPDWQPAKGVDIDTWMEEFDV